MIEVSTPTHKIEGWEISMPPSGEAESLFVSRPGAEIEVSVVDGGVLISDRSPLR